MSDLISRQAAIEHLKTRLYETAWNNPQIGYPYAEMAENRVGVWLEEVPTIDTMPVVRCKECTHWEYDAIFTDGWCREKRQGNPSWFCADGERKDDAE